MCVRAHAHEVVVVGGGGGRGWKGTACGTRLAAVRHHMHRYRNPRANSELRLGRRQELGELNDREGCSDPDSSLSHPAGSR